jgi:hypothetical protein
MSSYTLFGGIMDENTMYDSPQEKDKLHVCYFREEASETTQKRAIRKAIEISYEKDLDWIQIYTEGKKIWDSTEFLKSGEEISFDDLSSDDSEGELSEDDIFIEFNWAEIIKEKIRHRK